jgi:hypothetical protein
MRDEADQWNATLKRLLGESRAVSRQALRAGRQGDVAENASLPGRIAHIRAVSRKSARIDRPRPRKLRRQGSGFWWGSRRYREESAGCTRAGRSQGPEFYGSDRMKLM